MIITVIFMGRASLHFTTLKCTSP